MLSLKPIEEQVLVVTGASSGNGRAIALMAGRRGARVVLAARSADALEEAAGEIEAAGGQALAVPTDVADEGQVRGLAQSALDRFGTIDTWVNNAGVTILNRLEETDENDARRVFDVNFWGMVHGAKAALPTLKARGGALIQMGSLASDVATPLMGIYSATKHAMKGYTDALRMELMAEGAPVSVTLIKPGPIATPIMDNLRDEMGREMAMPPPYYPPEDVARVVLHAAEHGGRDRFVGGSAAAGSVFASAFPHLADRIGALAVDLDGMTTEAPPTRPRGNLDVPSPFTAVRGDPRGHLVRPSLYSNARNHPLAAMVGAVAVGMGAAALLRRR